MKRILFLLLIFVTALSACTPPPAPAVAETPAPGGAAYPAASSAGAYPYPGGAPAKPTAIDPYPAGAEAVAPLPTATAFPTPTVDASLGQVRGRLLEGTTPVADAYLYLAEVKADETGKELAAKITTGAPFAITDAEGYFHFFNVAPGRYGIVLDVVLNAYLLNVPDKEEAVLFTVANGQTTEVGELAYNEVPRPRPSP